MADPVAQIAAIEHAHHGATYNAQQAIQADFEVDFGQAFTLSGTMWFTPSMSHVRMELSDDTVVVYDGQTAWVSPADATTPGVPARFHVLTWPYFVAVPYKLDDPGTLHEDVGDTPVRDTSGTLPGVKVTFESGVGDTPDDWYIALSDPATHQLKALAYIVTYGTPAEEANKKPSIVLYDDFVEVDGVPFATTWTFHFWNPDAGVDGEPKGTASLSNVAFVTPPAGAFDKPDGARESPAP
ncbi:MAG: hypothetical protein AAFX76_04275 [Planctomycetota bacterium]